MGLEIGALVFVLGLAALYFSPFWHFDQGGFLDWRLYWWNAGGETLLASGLLIEVFALAALAAALVSRVANGRAWPYIAAAASIFSVIVWVGTEGFVRTSNASFEWNASEGFTVFRVGTQDDPPAKFPALDTVWQSVVEIQIQPLLRGYFKLNDWQKMNGEIEIKVARAVPVAWPVALGAGGETLEDPDQTALMRAAEKQDSKALRELLSAASRSDVNALDQDGETALILACRNPKPNPEIVTALIAAGADVNLRARNGYAPLTWARARNNTDIARILKRAGAKP